jgi:hypothetical protein
MKTEQEIKAFIGKLLEGNSNDFTAIEKLQNSIQERIDKISLLEWCLSNPILAEEELVEEEEYFDDGDIKQPSIFSSFINKA